MTAHSPEPTLSPAFIDLRRPDLRTIQPKTTVITTKGFAWQLLSRTPEGETWEDMTSKLIWLPATDERATWDRAMAKQNGMQSLPTKEEYEEAEKHGIREVLEMGGRWWWSSSEVRSYPHFACLFDGDDGYVTDEYSRRNSHFDVSFRMVRR